MATQPSQDQMEYLEKRLLEVYPEAKPLTDTITVRDGWGDVSISNTPYVGLFSEQKPEEGPFWTVLRADSNPRDLFHVISFGLNPEILSTTFFRRFYHEGIGGTTRGNDTRVFLEKNMKYLCRIYQQWFFDDETLKKL